MNTNRRVDTLIGWKCDLMPLMFFSSYDYENCTEEQGKQVMDRVKSLLTDPEFVGRTYTTNTGAVFKVLSIDDFAYTDPVDHSVSKNQVSIIQPKICLHSLTTSIE